MSSHLQHPCRRCGETAASADGSVCLKCIGERFLAFAGPVPDGDTAPRERAAPAPPAAKEDDESLDYIGPYEIIEELGRGGMGRVYAARQGALGRIVALKVIDEGGPDATDRELRFLREAQTMARLRHPHIVAVHDSGRVAGRIYFSMDLIGGGDLSRVSRAGMYSPRQVAALLHKVAAALVYAHGEGVLHRDLKPSNILLDGEEPRLADFGLAVPFESQGELTMTGRFLGTPHYLAPEVLREGSDAFSIASDVYALGVVLFQLLTGRTPFAGASLSELIGLVANSEPPSPRLLAPAVPRDLGTICLKCLERDPARRYADAGALAEDLRRFLAHEPIIARPVSAPVRWLRWSRRRPAAAALIAALALGAVGAVWAAVVINAGRQRALKAEAGAREELWRANLAHAQAARRNTQAGARREALDAIAEAARFRPSLALRDEAVSALCLDDAEIARTWPLNLEWGAAVAFDPALDSYVAEVAPGLLVRRACADDRELGRMEVPRCKVVGLPVFSPDGRHLAVRYMDKAVRVWEVGTGRVAFELPERPSPMTGNTANYGSDLAFRPDGGQLAVGLAEGGFSLHAVPGGGEQGCWTAGVRPSILSFSPDGGQIAVVGRAMAQVQFFDARTLAAQRTVPLPSVPICAAWNPAGDRLAVGTRGSRIHFVVPATGEIANTVTVYESGGVGKIVFHPQQPVLAGNGSDEAVRFWDAASGRLFLQMDGVNNVPVLAFNPTGTRLCAYDTYTNRATLVELRPSPIYKHVAPAQPQRATLGTGALDASRDGRWLVSSVQGAVELRDAASGRTLQTLPGADAQDNMTAQFAPDGRAVFVGSVRAGLRRVELVVGADGKPAFGSGEVLDAEPDFLVAEVSEAGRVLMFSEAKQTVKVVDPAVPGHAVRWQVARVGSAAFSADGCQVLTEGSEPVPGEAAVKVWDVTAADVRLTGSFGDDPGGRVQCSRAGGWVLTTGDRKTELWRAGTWEHGPALDKEWQGATHHARLSPDGATLVIEKNGKLHQFATATGQPMLTCEGVEPAGICVNEVFSADGKQLFLLWQYGSVHLWDLASMHRELARLGLDWNVDEQRGADAR